MYKLIDNDTHIKQFSDLKLDRNNGLSTCLKVVIRINRQENPVDNSRSPNHVYLGSVIKECTLRTAFAIAPCQYCISMTKGVHDGVSMCQLIDSVRARGALLLEKLHPGK